MKTRDKVLGLINEINASNPVMKDIFRYGSCMNFYHILKTVFPKARCWYNIVEGHVATNIDGNLYDITGEIKEIDGYQPIYNIWSGKYNDEQSLKFGEMYASKNKAEYIRK